MRAIIALCLLLQAAAVPSSSSASAGTGRFGSTHPPYASVTEMEERDFGSRFFLEEYVNEKEPVVIRGVGRNWQVPTLCRSEPHA